MTIIFPLDQITGNLLITKKIKKKIEKINMKEMVWKLHVFTVIL
jgi:hypothetical protein